MADTVLADLEALHRKLHNGTFFSDYDEDCRLMGVLRKHVETRRNVRRAFLKHITEDAENMDRVDNILVD